MNIINTVSTSRFSLNGIEYFKNYISKVAGDNVIVYNCYENADVLIEYAPYTDFTVNGVVYESAAELQAALIAVTYARTSGTGVDVNQNNVNKNVIYFFYGTGALTISEIVDKINFSGSLGNFVVSETDAPVTIDAFKSDGTSLRRHLYLFRPGKGVYGSGPGQTPVTSGDLGLINQFPATVEDVQDASNTQTIPLGVLATGDYLTAANAEARDLSDPDLIYFFSYTYNSELYLVQFIGTPGMYGGANPALTSGDLVGATNSTIEPTPIPTLQQVMDEGNESETPMVQLSPATEEKIQYAGDGITHQKNDVLTKTVFEENTVSVTHTVPAKPADDVYAFQSDLEGVGLQTIDEVMHTGAPEVQGITNKPLDVISWEPGEDQPEGAVSYHGKYAMGVNWVRKTDPLAVGGPEIHETMVNPTHVTVNKFKSGVLVAGYNLLPHPLAPHLGNVYMPKYGTNMASQEWTIDQLYFVKAEYFGAVADGVTDNAAAFEEAIASGFKKIIIGGSPGDVYYTSRTIKVDQDDKDIIVNGTVIMQDGSQDFLLADVPIGATTVPVADAYLKYFPGQQVCISSSVMPTQGGQTGQTRKYGDAFTVASVSGDIITLSHPTNYAFTVANSAKIGHCQTVFLLKGQLANPVKNVRITGWGKINQNKANQYDVEPVTYSLFDDATMLTEDVRFGCGISAVYTQNIFIGGGLTVEDTVLHGVVFFKGGYYDINRITIDGAHDKGLLMHYVNDFTVTDSRFLNCDYEDGIYMHNDAIRGFINNVYAENCNRRGFAIGNNSSHVTIDNAIAKDCGRAGEFTNSANISVKSFKSIGGGKDNHMIGGVVYNRPMFTIQGVTNSNFDLEVSGSTLAQAGISIIGATKDIRVKANITDLEDSESLGIGIIMGAASNVFPDRVTIHDSSILRNKAGLRLDHNGTIGCTNIKIKDSDVLENAVTITNSIGKEFRSENTRGITDTHNMTVMHCTTTPVTVTSTTSPTVAGYKHFPAGTLYNGTLEVDMTVEHTGSAGGFVALFCLNATPDLTGSPVTIATFIGGASNLRAPFGRRFTLNGNTLSGFNFATSLVRESGVENVAPGSTAWNLATTGKYVIGVIYPLNSADSAIMKNFEIRFKPTV